MDTDLAFTLFSLALAIGAVVYGVIQRKQLLATRRKNREATNILTIPKTDIPLVLPVGLFCLAATLFNLYRQLFM